MARDRKRAKQRQRRGVRPGSEPARSQLHRADLPGALEHAGDVDEFDAALVRGAGGVPAPGVLPEEEEIRNGGEPEANGTGAALVESGGGGRRGGRRRRGTGGGGDGAGDGAALPAPAESRQPLPARTAAFIRASWAELQRVQWPDRRQVTQATAVVIGFVAVAGAYFGLADYIAKEIVEAIL